MGVSEWDSISTISKKKIILHADSLMFSLRNHKSIKDKKRRHRKEKKFTRLQVFTMGERSIDWTRGVATLGVVENLWDE